MVLAEVNIMWFRRDLRLTDNAAFYHALKQGKPVLPIFIFDTNILDELEDKQDRRVEFIREALLDMQEKLEAKDSTLWVFYGKPEKTFEELLKKYKLVNVFTNHDYDPYAIDRDAAIKELLAENSVGFYTYKDQVIFEKNEVVKADGKPYTVFTPYSRVWKEKLRPFYLKTYPTEKYFKNLYQRPPCRIPSLESMGFKNSGLAFPPRVVKMDILKHYKEQRDFPAIHGTSRLSVHLRFGTLSIRQLAAKAKAINETFLNELIWRDFYQAILFHFPHVGKGKAFKPEYDHIRWRNNEAEFEAWCQGKTGYPIVDAGMRELNETGFMHNRVRMITASFLVKHLLIDWRWGEAYFGQKLLDYELASNNGGWQWAASSGCDAVPYFRIFNPTLQTQKFDTEHKYIKQWIPEYDTPEYPRPIVEHEFARKRALEVYKKGLEKK